MANKARIALAATGVLLVVAAALVKWVAAPALVKVPLDVKSTTVSEADGQVFVLAQQSVLPVHVIATRTVHGDKSAGTGRVAVYDETLCLVAKGTKVDGLGCAPASDPGFIDKSTDRVAFDRKSAMAVAGARFKASVNGDAAIAHDGLDYTFPIDTKKKTYPLYDTVAGKAYPAVYQGSEKFRGMTVYRFVQQIPAVAITIQKLLPGTYSGTTTVWVEPSTGVIVKGAQQIVERFASGGGTVFDANLVFNDTTVREQVDYANSQLTKIHLIRLWVPLGVAALGLVLLVAGLLVGRRRAAPPVDGRTAEDLQPETSQT